MRNYLMTNHPITPPQELVREWTSLANEEEGHEVWSSIATQAAQWGADQELEACCEWLRGEYDWGLAAALRLDAERRPDPPSLKEQALSELNLTADPDGAELSRTQVELIRRALEAL